MKTIHEINLVITHRCNLNCIYCYEVNKDNGEMSLELAKSVLVKYLSKKTCDELAINLFGGEPFLRFPFIKELCEWTWRQKWPQQYLFYADTNGVSLSEEVKEWAEKNRERFIMLISLDGTPKTHNLNRSNSFERIDLDFFHKNWPTQGVKMTISDQHLDSLAEDIIFLHEKGFKVKGANIAEGFLIKDFERKFQVVQEQYSLLINWYIAHPDIEVAQLFDLRLSLCETHKNKPVKYCGCGSNVIKVIDIDGAEYPCTYFFPLSMNRTELKKVQCYDLTQEDLFIDQDCLRTCYIYPICKGCYGDNYSTTGLFSKRSEQKCKLAKLRAASVAKLQAHRMLANNYNTITEEGKDTIIAIQKIAKLFSFPEKPIAEKVEA